MKADTQHLDFLISQYVDGCLEGASKKSVEQQMLTDPDARKLYTEHREVQDLLDDWGSRIPLIDWQGFDKKLGEKLEKEAVGGQRRLMIRRWIRPLAAAAALFVAATVGYGWHAMWSPTQPVPSNKGGMSAMTAQPIINVSIIDQPKATQPSQSGMTVEEPAIALSGGQTVDPKAVAVALGDAEAAEALKEAVGYGLQGVKDLVGPSGTMGSNYVFNDPAPRGHEESVPQGNFPESPSQPGFPYP